MPAAIRSQFLRSTQRTSILLTTVEWKRRRPCLAVDAAGEGSPDDGDERAAAEAGVCLLEGRLLPTQDIHLERYDRGEGWHGVEEHL